MATCKDASEEDTKDIIGRYLAQAPVKRGGGGGADKSHMNSQVIQVITHEDDECSSQILLNYMSSGHRKHTMSFA